MAVNSDGTRVYVANFLDNTITVVNTVSGQTTTIANVSSPGALAISPDNSRIYVLSDNTATTSNGLTVINSANTADRYTIDVGEVGLVNGMALSADGKRLYLSNAVLALTDPTTLTVVDTATRATSTFDVSGIPVGVTLSPTGRLLWVTTVSAAEPRPASPHPAWPSSTPVATRSSPRCW